DGSWRWVLSRGRVVERDEAGQALRVTGTHTDVTERREAAEAREVLARTVEASHDMVKLLDATGRVTYMNGAGLRLLGAPSLDAVRGVPFRDLLTEADRERVDQSWRAMLTGPGVWKGDCHLKPLDGRPPVHIEAYEF